MTKINPLRLAILMVVCFSLSACKAIEILRFKAPDAIVSKDVASSGAEHNKPAEKKTYSDSSVLPNEPDNVSVSSAQKSEKTETELIFNRNFASCSGRVSYAYHNYESGESFTHNSQRMKSASVIKLFIMEYAYSLIESGELLPDTPVSGSRVSALIESMITVSDNNATNALISYFTMDKLNAYFADSGYSDTSLGRKMLDFEAQKKGNDNFTSANDVMKFLNKLYSNKDKSPYSDMLDVLSRQKISTKIRRDMPANVKICNKTGELSDVENDAGIVFTENGDFAVVFIVNSSDSGNVQNIIAKTTRRLYDDIIKN